MTKITKDFDEVWMHATPKGMAFSIGGNEQDASVYLRAVLDARTREDWHIDEVHMVSFDFPLDPVSMERRRKEYVNVLEGPFAEEAKAFLYAAHDSDLQDAVDLEILSTGELVA